MTTAEASSLTPPRRSAKTHFKNKSVFLRKLSSQDSCLVSVEFLTDTQNSPCTTPFLDCILIELNAGTTGGTLLADSLPGSCKLASSYSTGHLPSATHGGPGPPPSISNEDSPLQTSTGQVEQGLRFPSLLGCID